MKKDEHMILMNWKRHGYLLESVRTMADTIVKQYGNMVDQTLENWKSQEVFYKPNEFLGEQIDRFARDCIKLNVKEEILSFNEVMEEVFYEDE